MLFPRMRLRRAVLHEVRPYIGGRLRQTFAAGGLTRGKTLHRRAFEAGFCGGQRGCYRGWYRRHHRLAADDDDDGVYGTIINLPLSSVLNS